MRREVQAVDLHGHPRKAALTSLPSACPQCHKSIIPKFLTAVSTLHNGVSAIFQCTNDECLQVFIGKYESSRDGANIVHALASVTPVRAKPARVPASVEAISPAFVTILNQATAAAAQGLDQIHGIGLRKALEFLVKDFAIAEHPNDAEEIKKTLLAKCIDTYISDPQVKRCATLATWLGNDETHYVRKWETKDIEDLKILIHLTVNWIENFCLTRQYVNDMAGGAAPAKP